MSGKLRIGIIGAGAAGLSTAWMLDKDRYEVTLFEAQDRLGGHAHTVTVPYNLNGKNILVHVDAGAQFFYDNYHVMFKRLLGILQVPISDWVLDFAVVNQTTNPPTKILVTGNTRNEVQSLLDQFVSFFRHDNIWEAIKSVFSTVSDDAQILFNLLKFINLAQTLVMSQNWGITVEEYLNSLKDSSKGTPLLPPEFVDDFLLPFLTSIWTVGDKIEQSSAYAVLTYVGLGHPSVFNLFGSSSFAVWAVVDGTLAYVTKLAADIQAEGKTISYPAPVSQLTHNADGSWSAQVNGADAGTFDHIIIAAPAWNAIQFLGDTDPERSAILQQYDYFHTQVIVHGDTSFMPDDPTDWSAVYQYWNGFNDYYQTTWQGVEGVNVFKTWVTFSSRKPDPSKIYQTIDFHHPDHHLQYFANQVPLAALQGRNNLWLAGSYTFGVDSHETAIRSGASVVTRLDNITGGAVSPNLQKLFDWTTQYVPPLKPTQL